MGGKKKMQEQDQSQIKARIEELRKRFENLQRTCNSWASVSPETLENYAREIERLQGELN